MFGVSNGLYELENSHNINATITVDVGAETKNNIDKVEPLEGQITVEDVIPTYNNAEIKKEIVVDNSIDDEMEEVIPECYF